MTTESKRTARWFFDPISPYAYIQHELLRRDPPDCDLEPTPVLFAGLLNHFGHKGPAEIPSKRLHTYRHVTWLARRHGMDLVMPHAHPFNPLPLLRASIALENEWPAIQAIFDFVWKQGQTPTAGTFPQLLSELGLNEQQLSAPEVKNALRKNTEAAVAAGVFGVPTLACDGCLFWGVDTTDMFRDYLAGKTDWASLDELAKIPEAAKRR